MKRRLRFALPKVRWDSAPDFPIITTELSIELMLNQVNLPVFRHIASIVGKKRDPEPFLAQIRKVEARLGKLAKIRKVETD